MENYEDYSVVENLVRNAFWNLYRPGAFEHYIVHNLRDDESFIDDLAYVIEDNGKIVGHINYSVGKIDNNGKTVDAVVLGPLTVHNDFQNQGLGSKLVEYTLDKVKQKGIPFVFVIGDENYYRRFGFVSASQYNVFLDGTDKTDECPFFMIMVFDDEEIENVKGTFFNPDVFDVSQRDVDEFDGQFEFKEKLVLEGQLE